MENRGRMEHMPLSSLQNKLGTVATTVFLTMEISFLYIHEDNRYLLICKVVSTFVSWVALFFFGDYFLKNGLAANKMKHC